MATIGVQDVFLARMTYNEGVYTNPPVRVAKAIKVELSTKSNVAKFYADDELNIMMQEFQGGTLKLTVDDLTIAKEGEISGSLVSTTDPKTVVLRKDDTPPFYAVGFRANRPDGTSLMVWLYKVQFAPMDMSFDTQNESIAFGTPTISGEVLPLSTNGRWCGKAVGQYPGASGATDIISTWFNEVKLAT